MENNDKAKQILFGGKNLGGDPLWNTEGVSQDNPETKMNEEALRGHKPEASQLVASDKADFYCFAVDEGMIHSTRCEVQCESCLPKEEPDSQALENITRKLNDAGIPVSNPEESRTRQGHLKVTNPDEDELQMFIDYTLWPKEWFDKVVAYCREQGINPEQLIEDHKLWRRLQDHIAFKEKELKTEIEEYDKKHYPK